MRETLSCCLVVRNEEKKIASCLDTINILADEIIIVDTGSTDNTIKAIAYWINKYNAQKGVKVIRAGNKFHDEDGDFDFGAAKTFAFEQATKSFVMWMDANDQISDQKEMKKAFIKETTRNPNIYFVIPTAVSEKFAFNRTRIGPKKHSKIKGKIHESMLFNVPDLERFFIPIVIKNFKKERDIKRNLRLLMKEWAVNPSARTCFYIANTYREMLDTEKALEWFKKRIYEYDINKKIDDKQYVEYYKEEFFKSLECISEIMLGGSKKNPKVNLLDLFDIAKEMIKMEPLRYEGYYYLAKYYTEKGKWNEALNEFRKYKLCKKPETFKLWVNGAIYKGKSILNNIEYCKTAIKNKDILKPDVIEDLNPMKSTYKPGNSQYY